MWICNWIRRLALCAYAGGRFGGLLGDVVEGLGEIWWLNATGVGALRKTLDPSFRWDDGFRVSRCTLSSQFEVGLWIPAFAGMTGLGF